MKVASRFLSLELLFTSSKLKSLIKASFHILSSSSLCMNEWQSFEAARNDRRSNESKHGATKNEKVDAGIDRMFVCAMFDMLLIYNITEYCSVR